MILKIMLFVSHIVIKPLQCREKFSIYQKLIDYNLQVLGYLLLIVFLQLSMMTMKMYFFLLRAIPYKSQ